MSFGRFEGIENASRIPDCPMKVFFQAPEKYHPVDEGGESMEELFARTGNFIEEVIRPQLKQGKDILIVGHGAMNSSIVCQIKGWTLEQFWDAGIENCKLMRLI